MIKNLIYIYMILTFNINDDDDEHLKQIIFYKHPKEIFFFNFLVKIIRMSSCDVMCERVCVCVFACAIQI